MCPLVKHLIFLAARAHPSLSVQHSSDMGARLCLAVLRLGKITYGSKLRGCLYSWDHRRSEREVVVLKGSIPEDKTVDKSQLASMFVC